MTPRLLIGILIIGIGALLLLGNLQILEIGNVWRFWPVLLLVAGVNMMFRSRFGPGLEGGVVLTVLGGAFLLRTLGYLDWRFRHLWPLLLILLGLAVVVTSFRRTTPPRSGKQSSASPEVSLFTFLGGVDHQNNSPAFRGGEATALMGGIDIDLREAGIVDGDVELNCFAFMGGIEIKVPPDWSVIIKATPIMGYIGGSAKAGSADGSKKLTVRGQAFMGSIEVKN